MVQTNHRRSRGRTVLEPPMQCKRVRASSSAPGKQSRESAAFSFWRKDFYYTICMFLLRESFPLTAKRAPRFSLCNLSPLPYLVRTAEISHTTKDFGGLWGMRTEISGRYRKLDISAGKMKWYCSQRSSLFAGSQGRSKLLVYGSFDRPHHAYQGLGCCKRGLA